MRINGHGFKSGLARRDYTPINSLVIPQFWASQGKELSRTLRDEILPDRLNGYDSRRKAGTGKAYF